MKQHKSGDLLIIIPTYRRVDMQKTLRHMPKDWIKRTVLICDSKDAARFESMNLGARIHVHPKDINSIAQKRRYIIEKFDGKILMLDDDLRICVRDFKRCEGTDSLSLIRTATPKEAGRMFELIEKKLDKFVHVGIGARPNNNAIEKTQRNKDMTKKEMRWWPNFRMMYALGYNTLRVRPLLKLGRIEHREDMDYTLQLLRQGYANRILVEYSVDQLYNTKGGESEFGSRSVEASNADALKLHKFHKKFVKVVEKDYKVSVKRQEVICYWKKAYEEGKEKRFG